MHHHQKFQEGCRFHALFKDAFVLLILNYCGYGRCDFFHLGRQYTTGFTYEPLHIDSSQLEGVYCGWLGQAIQIVRINFDVPDVLLKMALPTGYRGYKLDRQFPDGIRADRNNSSLLIDLGPYRWIEIDEPYLAALGLRRLSCQ